MPPSLITTHWLQVHLHGPMISRVGHTKSHVQWTRFECGRCKKSVSCNKQILIDATCWLEWPPWIVLEQLMSCQFFWLRTNICRAIYMGHWRIVWTTLDHKVSEMDVNGVVARKVLLATNKLKRMWHVDESDLYDFHVATWIPHHLLWLPPNDHKIVHVGSMMKKCRPR